MILFSSISGLSQNTPVWIIAVENTIKQKETVWKIGSKIERPRDGDYSFVLKSGKSSSAIQIGDSQKAYNYKETFTALVSNFDQNMGKNMNKAVLENFGDEGFIWTSVNKGGYSMIKFRKKDIFVDVFAPSEETAKRFAQYVLEQMPED